MTALPPSVEVVFRMLPERAVLTFSSIKVRRTPAMAYQKVTDIQIRVPRMRRMPLQLLEIERSASRTARMVSTTSLARSGSSSTFEDRRWTLRRAGQPQWQRPKEHRTRCTITEASRAAKGARRLNRRIGRRTGGALGEERAHRSQSGSRTSRRRGGQRRRRRTVEGRARRWAKKSQDSLALLPSPPRRPP